MESKFSTIPRRVYNWSIEHWIISSLVPFLSSSFVIFLNCFGVNFSLKTVGGGLSWYVFFPALIFYILGVLFTVGKSLGDQWNEKAKNRAQKFLGHINSNLSQLTEYEYRRLQKYIIRDNPSSPKLNDIVDPLMQIELILSSLRSIISDVFGIGGDYIGISILYKNGANWEFLSTINVSSGLTSEQLTTDHNTTIYQIIAKKHHHLFHADKQKAIQSEEYSPDALDSSYGNKGSIYCSNISIELNKIQAILSVSTYSKQICDENDENAAKLLIDSLFKLYEKRLQVQLALMHLSNSGNKKEDILKPLMEKCPLFLP